MIAVIGQFRLPIANREYARPLMERVTLATRAGHGCLAYSYAEDVLEPGLYRVSELWDSREALAVHFAAPHMQDWQRERAELGFSDRVMKSYEVTGEELL
jgi:quinol monooxygenase YgiN